MQKTERINQELFFLHDKKSFNLKDLMTTFNISKSTALRDISELESLGLPLYVEPGRYGKYHLLETNLLPPVYFSENEIYSIFFTLQLLELMANSPFGHVYNQITDKLLQTFPEQTQQKIEQTIDCVRYDGIMQTMDTPYLDQVFEAILKQQAITFSYHRKEIETRLLYPVRLVHRNGHWYCIGFDLKKDEYRTFRCGFMQEIKLLDKQPLTLSNEEIEAALQEQNNQFRTLEFKVEINQKAYHLYQQNHYPNLKVSLKNQHYLLTGSINPSELDFLTNYLLQFGENILSIETPEVKIAYQALLKRMQQQAENF